MMVEEAREDFLSVCLLNLLNRGFNAQDVMEQMYNNNVGDEWCI